MNYRIVEKPAFSILGKALRVSTANEAQLERIPQFWDELRQNGSIGRLGSMAAAGGQIGKNLLGICKEGANAEFVYVIAVENTAGVKAAGFETFIIPALTWGVFEASGPVPNAIQELFKRIYTEFFPAGGYERGNGPDIEVYYEGDIHSLDYRFEVWIPLIKKNSI